MREGERDKIERERGTGGEFERGSEGKSVRSGGNVGSRKKCKGTRKEEMRNVNCSKEGGGRREVLEVAKKGT